MRRLLLIVFLVLPSTAAAQSFETVGARALGMGGAFVGVADDASATWWNPAGLATGPFFNLSVEKSRFETERPLNFGLSQPADRDTFFLSATTLPIGLSYAQTSDAWATLGPADEALVRGLRTRQFGATVVQSLSETIVVAATLKYVRGTVLAGPREAGQSLADAFDGLEGDADGAFDADIGLLATSGRLKAGVTFRNVTSPEFEGAGGIAAELPWRARAGVSYAASSSLLVAIDAELRAVTDELGEARMLAFGAEWRKAGTGPFALRAGARMDTIGESRPLGTVGASYAVRNGLWIDVWAAEGAETADRGWGVAGRIAY